MLIEKIIIALGGVAAGYSIAMVRKDISMKHFAGKIFASYSRLYNSLNNIVQNTSVERVILLKQSDFDGAEFGSILFEQHSDRIPGAMYTFQKNPLDEHYRKQIIAELLRRKILFIVASELPRDSFLWRKYKADGVTASVVCLVGHIKNKGIRYRIKRVLSALFGFKFELSKTYYLSCNTKSETFEIFTPAQRVVIESEANAIGLEFLHNKDLKIL